VRSSYYSHRKRKPKIDVDRLRLRSRVNTIFTRSRSSAGSRTIKDMLQAEGTVIGRFKVRSLMREAGLISKQPGSHRYKKATVERLDIPNRLNREFDVSEPDEVWSGLKDAGIILPWCWIFIDVGWLAGRSRRNPMQISLSSRWTWLTCKEVGREESCFIAIREASMPADYSAKDCGDTAWCKA